MKIRPVGTKIFHVEEQKGRQTWAKTNSRFS